MIKYRRTLIATLILLLLSISLFILYAKLRNDYRLKNAGIPYADERTISIFIAGVEEFVIKDKSLNSVALTKHLNDYRAEFGTDCPIVMNFHPNTMDKDLNSYLSPIADAKFYNLFCLYKDEILNFHIPCPRPRTGKCNLVIYVPSKENKLEEKHQVIIYKLYKDTGDSKKINMDVLLSELSQNHGDSILLVWQNNFIPVKSFLELLHICKKAGCSTPTIGEETDRQL